MNLAFYQRFSQQSYFRASHKSNFIRQVQNTVIKDKRNKIDLNTNLEGFLIFKNGHRISLIPNLGNCFNIQISTEVIKSELPGVSTS